MNGSAWVTDKSFNKTGGTKNEDQFFKRVKS